MKLLLEAHVLQNVAPSNLNRDDTGAPKDALFGGHRRLRVSSQCLKRAQRAFVRDGDLLAADRRGVRTKRLVEVVRGHLPADLSAEADHLVRRAAAAVELKLDDDGRSEYLIFLGATEIRRFADVLVAHRAALSGGEGAADSGAGKAKKAAKAALPREVQTAVEAVLSAPRAVDVAMFGRMLANAPKFNVDAACQVAHAISTHRVEREFDYFTAVDDVAPASDPGAPMIGTVEFASGCLYRYCAIDVRKLRDNLGGDTDLAIEGIAAYLRAIVLAEPTGKQNTFAAHNPPGYVLFSVRSGLPMSLANAFERPIQTQRAESLTAESVKALESYATQLTEAFGSADDRRFVLDLTGASALAGAVSAGNVDSLVSSTVEQARTRLEA